MKLQLSKRRPSLRRLTALLVAAACVTDPVFALDVIIGDTTTEDVSNNSFAEVVTGNLILGNQVGGDGTYNLSGTGTLQVTTTAAAMIVGNAGIGTFNHLAGTVDAAGVILGSGNSGTGTYNLSDGTLNIVDGPGNRLIVGENGNGTFVMDGGTLNVLNSDINTNAFGVGDNAGSVGLFTQNGGAVNGGRSLTLGSNGGTGTYDMNGGTLNVSILTLGFSGSGTFNQTDGSVATNNIFMGTDQAAYNLSGGSLTVQGGQGTIVGTFNVAEFNQSGGTHETNELIVGNQSFARGVYNMRAGSLSVLGDMLIGRGQADVDPGVAGLFHQTGGDVVTNTLWIGGDTRVPFEEHRGRGRYELVDGTVTSQVTLVGNISPGSVLQTGGIFNAGNLLIGRSGSFTEFGSVTETSTFDLQAGQLNTTGTTISQFGMGTFNHTGGDHNVIGNLVIGEQTALVDPFPGLGRVLQGIYNLSGGGLNVVGDTVLGAADDSKGTFNQSGGVVTLTGNLVIASGSNAEGTFNLTGSGVLTVTGDVALGRGGLGVFTQNGVNTQHTVGGTLYLGGGFGQVGDPFAGGETSFTNGIYNLESGTLQTGATWIGEAAVGVFNQSGGNHTTGSILLGNCGGCLGANSNGTYNLTGGDLNVGSLTVSGFGRGLFSQSGGTATVSGDMVVGSAPALGGTPTREGFVTLSGGVLSVLGKTTVGAGNDFFGDPLLSPEPGAKGTFTQSGGAATYANDIIIGGYGIINGGTGSYVLSGPGSVLVDGGNSTMIIAQQGATGSFTQSAGSVSVTGFLIIGEDAGAVGTYTLSGGTVTAGNTILGGGFVGTPGAGGAGTFIQSGGTFQTGFLNIGGGGFAQKGQGSYTLSAGNLVVDGSLNMGNDVGGSALFTQTGGAVLVNGLAAGNNGLYVNNGSYLLSGTGTLGVANNLIVGGSAGTTGVFEQSGSSQVSVGHDLSIGTSVMSTGQYLLSAGTVNVANAAYIGDAGAGTLELSSNGIVNVAGKTYVGNQATGGAGGLLSISGNGVFNGTGEVVVAANAGGTGAVLIGDTGSLSIAFTGTGSQLIIGSGGMGTMQQSGGSTVTVGSLRVGGQLGSTGSYTMNGGALNVVDGTGVAGGMRIGLAGNGTFTQNGGVVDAAYVQVGGANFGQVGGGTGTYQLSNGTLTSAGGIAINVDEASTGTFNVAGGSVSAPSIVNNDKLNYSGGSISANVTNNATFAVSGGAARTLTGDLTNNVGGILQVAALTPLTITGVLTQASGASIKSDANITIGKDYNNLGAGNGNSFDRHVGVTNGSGGSFTQQIIGLNAAQTIIGNVAAAGVDTFTLNIGNVRGGSGPVTKDYQIQNSGSGADIRGAIQTAGMGNITDARLSGTGVTAGNFGPILSGSNSGNLSVTFNGAAGAALSGQKIAVVSNFDNVNTQIININGGAVSALAVGNATPNSPSPLNLGNFRVGTAGADQSFAVQNQTTGVTAEQLGVNSVNASSGFSASNVLGTALVAGGATQSGAVTARANGSGSAGINTGTVTINYATDGTNVDASFARQAANSQVINLSATGYNAAAGSATPSPVNLGNFRVGTAGGAAPQSQDIAVSNTVAGPFTEGLGIGSASIGAGAFTLTNNLGAGLVAAGGASANALNVARTGGVAGVNTGTVSIQYTTDGLGTSGLAAANVNMQSITVSASGYNAAAGSASPAPVNLGNFHVGLAGGAAPQSQNIAVTNTVVGAFTEGLGIGSASIGAGAFSLTNNLGSSLIAAGATSTNALNVARTGGVAGVNTGTVSIQYTTDGLGTSGLAATNVNTQGVSVNATGYRLAQANTIAAVAFGNVHVGDTVTQALSISNTQVADSFSEKLNASFGTVSDMRITTNGGSINQLAAGNTNASSMVVGLNTAAAGNVSGTVQVVLKSDGTGTSGLGLTDLPDQQVGVSGNISLSGGVYRLASASPVSPNPVNFGNVRINGVTDQALTLTNTAIDDGFSEKLNASIGGATAGVKSNNGSFALLAAQSTDNASLRVSLDTTTAGAKNGTAAITLVSDGTGTSGLGQTPLIGQTVTITGNVFRLATGDATVAPLDLGNFRLSAPTATGSLAVKNTAANDGSSEQLGIQSVSSGNALFTASNALGSSRVNAQVNVNGAVTVGLGTGLAAGVNNGSVAIQYLSDGTVSGTGAPVNSNLQTVNVSATGWNSANGSAAPGGPINLGNFRVGQAGGAAPQSQAIALSNTVAGPNTEGLGIASAGVSGNFTLANNLGGGLVAAGATTNNALNVARNGGSAGLNTGTVSIQYTTDGSGSSGLAAINANSQAITVNANGYNMAVGAATPSPIVMHRRVGETAMQALTVSNQATASVFSEALNAAFSASAGDAGHNGGSISNLIAGGSNAAAMVVSLNTATAGAKLGSVTLGYQTDGTGPNGNSGLAADSAGTQTIQVSGNVYTKAIAQVAPGSVNFGIVHVGDVVAQQSVAVSNTAAVTALNDKLTGSIGGATGPFSASGNLGAGVAAQQTDNSSLKVGLATTTAGVFSSSASVALKSHNADMADADLGTSTVNLLAQVNNYANLRFVSGSSGLSNDGGDLFTLDFGTVTQGSSLLSATLRALNAINGPSDLADGEYCPVGQVCDTDNFTLAGLTDFMDLDAGQSTDDLSISFDPTSLGQFQDEIVLGWFGHNASGYRGANEFLRLQVRALVVDGTANVPEPGNLLLVFTGLMLLGASARRRARGKIIH